MINPPAWRADDNIPRSAAARELVSPPHPRQRRITPMLEPVGRSEAAKKRGKFMIAPEKMSVDLICSRFALFAKTSMESAAGTGRADTRQESKMPHTALSPDNVAVITEAHPASACRRDAVRAPRHARVYCRCRSGRLRMRGALTEAAPRVLSASCRDHRRQPHR